jgi:DNA-binding GntR family transcriptional regulator
VGRQRALISQGKAKRARDAAVAAAIDADLSRMSGDTQGGRAYRALKTRLLVGDFPPNVRLGEERLAALLDVSRTPVREALKRLAAEGLVGPHPDGGYQPVVPDVTVMRHLYEVRAGLELQALQRPARLGIKHDPAVLEPLRDQWRALEREPEHSPDPNFALLDESFHVALATAAGNDVAVGLLRQVNERIRIVRMHDFLTTRRIEITIAEHLGIVEHVLAGDLVAAEAAFSQHLGDSMAVVEERVQGAIVRMLTGGNT